MTTRRQFLQKTFKAGLATALVPLIDSGSRASAQPRTQAAQAAPAANAGHPNILLLFPDQWRFDWTSANSDLPIRTPNLDRLASLGTRFANAMVATPLCAPSRACLASGREYGRCGVPSNGYDYPVRIKTFYSRLRDAGYHVLGCGKMDLAKASDWWGIDGKWRLNSWGFSDGINNAGKIDQVIGYELNNNRPADPYLTFLDDRGLLSEHLDDLRSRMKGGYGATYPTPLPENAYCDNWLAANGLDLIDAAPKGKPWFLQVNWTGPHNPEDITAPMEKRVRGLAMPAVNGSNQYNAAQNHAIRQNYTAMCENIDRTIGLYLDKLESLGQLDNTLILFSSDHGEMLGDHGRWGKTVPYHPSACVPLTVAGPGVRKGASSSALINHIDLAATCLDFAGIAPPKDVDSLSFRPVLEGRSTSHRDVVFSGLGAWRMAWDGHLKVITGFNAAEKRNNPDWPLHAPQVDGVAPLVFDLSTDPGENRDLSSSMPSQARQLLDRLNTHTAELEAANRKSSEARG